MLNGARILLWMLSVMVARGAAWTNWIVLQRTCKPQRIANSTSTIVVTKKLMIMISTLFGDGQGIPSGLC